MITETASGMDLILDTWYKGDKTKLISRLEEGIVRAKKERNIKLHKLLTEDLKILQDLNE